MREKPIGERTGLIMIIILLVAVGQLLLTLFIGIGSGTDQTEIYVRNMSTIVSLLVLVVFFDIYGTFHQPMFADIYDIILKRMKIITLILAAASLVKALISAAYAATYLNPMNIVCLYYFGEAVVWAAVFLFALAYFNRLRKKTID